MHNKFVECAIWALTLLSVLSQVLSVFRVRKFTNEKRSKFEILDFIGRVEEQGRTAEWHNVTTDDGYILALFRIPPNPLLHNKSHNGPSVYMQHALSTSADMYVSPDPAKSLAYILSDAGYDVWLGNLRGTVYSNKHETLSSDQPQFWDFSLDEAALIDVPSMLDYVLETTGKSKLSYIGYSMGSTLSTILLSNRTEYNDKMNLVVHFSHSVLWVYPSLVTLWLAVVGELLKSAVVDATFGLVSEPNELYVLVKHLCGRNIFFQEICAYSYDSMFGKSYERIDFGSEEFLSSILHFYSGTSAKLLLHYLQYVRTGEFRYYDYGDDETNLRSYGQIQPPYYNISNIAAPHLIFHGTNDILAVPENVPVFISKLPSTTTAIFEPVKNFNHNDFLLVKDVKRLVYDKLLVIMSKFSNND